MDPFLTPRPRRRHFHPKIKDFSKADVLNIISSFDFTSISVPFEEAALSDEITTSEFLASFFSSLSETVIKNSPPKISPKKIIERTLLPEPDTPTRSTLYYPLSSTGDSSQMSGLEKSFPIQATEFKVTQQVPALRVANLNVDVTETMLGNFFGRVGGVTAVSLSRDPVTGNSNGIGHVKFINMDYGMQSFQTPLTSANTALNQLNNTLIDGRPCQLTWYQRKSMNLQEKLQYLKEADTRRKATSIFPNKF